jgi:hypothetical protein|tara:strand:- start:1463 stop:1732 length:270 start_codon:yes stop_codon:yes gene_type:complete
MPRIKGFGITTLPRAGVLIFAAGTFLGVMSIVQIIDSEQTSRSKRDEELATCKQRVRQLMSDGRTEESIQRLTRCLDVHRGGTPNASER